MPNSSAKLDELANRSSSSSCTATTFLYGVGVGVDDDDGGVAADEGEDD